MVDMSSDAVTVGTGKAALSAGAWLSKPFDFVRSRFWLLVRIGVFYAALLGLWQLLYELEIWSPYLFRSPGEVWEELRKYIDNGLLWDAIQATMKRMFVGYMLAFLAGTLIGIACGAMRWVDETMGGLVLGLQSLPSISWIPLAILWFGLNDDAIIFVVFMGSVCAIAISARDGVRNIPPLQQRTARVFGASRWQSIRYVTLPGMVPSMVQGLKLGWSFSWRSLMAGEIIVQGTIGVGGLLQTGRDLNNMSLILAIMSVIIAIGVIVDRFLFGPAESWVRSRWGLAHA
jgi:NitT/TauT family transport system permease protein